MPMTYLDQWEASYLTAPGSMEGVIQTALNAVGLRDPVSTYEPGKSDADVYTKYSISLAQASDSILRIPNGASQRDLTRTLKPLLAIRDSLAPAFVSGAISGKRDHDRLGEMVQGSRDLDRDIRAARAKYGQQPPKALAPEVASVATTSAPAAGATGDGGIPMGLILGGGALLLLLALKK